MYFNPNSIEDQDKKVVQNCLIFGIKNENIKSTFFIIELFFDPANLTIKMENLFSLTDKKDLSPGLSDVNFLI